jgi:hypothetical protein
MKEYLQLCLVLIDQVSLIGARMLYNVDTRLSEIMYTPIMPFGNIDIILCSDLSQPQPTLYSLIFEQPSFHHDKILCTFWIDNVKYFELKEVMRESN